jgi:hypothetical protein
MPFVTVLPMVFRPDDCTVIGLAEVLLIIVKVLPRDSVDVTGSTTVWLVEPVNS